MCNANLKILSVQECDVFVVGNMTAIVSPNTIEKIPLRKGEYWVELISTDNPAYKAGQIITMDDSDKIICNDFLSQIRD